MNIKPKPRTNTTTQIMQRIKKNTIKIAYWNANAINNTKQELEHFIQKHKIDAVQETHLKPHRKLNLPNHQIYRNGSWQINYLYQVVSNRFSNKIMSHLNVLGSFMEQRIFCQPLSTLVIVKI
jgi:hypothetical protein